MGTYTIGQVAERTGFTTSTLRYYEQHGLLEPAGRTPAGYRVYDERSLARLGFIDRAKQLGCSLEEIADLAELWASQDCAPVQTRLHDLVTAKVADAQRRSTELVEFIAQLQLAAAHLGVVPVDGPCHDGCACLSAPADAGETSAPVAVGPHAEAAIACTLSPGELSDRIDDWQAILTHVTHREPTPDGGLRLHFHPAVPLDELTRLACAEQTCCAFFAFAITIDHRGVALEVRAPEDARELVTAMFGDAA